MRKRVLLILLAVVVVGTGIFVALGLIRENNYKKAVTMVKHEAFSDAMAEFSALGDYRESAQYMDYCMLRRSIEQNDWKAIKRFSGKIPDFLDADMYSQLCTAYDVYQEGSLEEAITILRNIASLDAVDELLHEVQSIYAAESVRMIQSRIDVADWNNALSLAENALLYCENTQITEMKRQCSAVISERDYNAAILLIQMDDYSNAASLLGNLTGYRDSDALLKHLKSGDSGCAYVSALLSNEKDPHILTLAFEKAGDYEDAPILAEKYAQEARQMDYQQAIAYIQQENWNKAIEIMEGVEDYKDVSVLMIICQQGLIREQYEQAISLMSYGELSQAETILKEIGEYSDAPVRLLLLKNESLSKKYNAATFFYVSGDLDKAYELFSQLGDYKDSAMYLSWLEISYDGSANE